MLSDTAGATAVLTGLALATVMGFVALGLQATTSLHAKVAMQAAADNAAIAGTLAFRAGSTGNPARIAAMLLAQNGYSVVNGHAIRIAAPVHANPHGRVEVQIDQPRIGRFTSLLRDDGGTVAVRAVAQLVDGRNGCALANAANAPVTIPRASEVVLNGCELLSVDSGIPLLRIAEADPYRDIRLANPAVCNARRTIVNSAAFARSGGRPYTFCGGLVIDAAGNLELEPGVYVIAGGPLHIRRGGRLASRNATIILAAGSTAHFDAGAIIDLQAPVSGALAGLALASAQGLGSSSLVAGATQRIEGAVHLPEQILFFAGSAGSPCTQIIAHRLVLAGPTRLADDCHGKGTRPIRDRSARLVE